MQMLRRTLAFCSDELSRTRFVASGVVVRMFPGTTDSRCIWQFSTTEISPDAPRLCPSAALWE